MGDVSKGEGRTVLFVSHNLTAVKELCNRGILLQHGQLQYVGPILETALEYQKMSETETHYLHEGHIDDALGNENIRILEFKISPAKGEIIDIESGIDVLLRFRNHRPNINLDATFELRTLEESVVFHTGVLVTKNNNSEDREYSVKFALPANLLNTGNYYFNIIFGENQRTLLYSARNIIGFEVENVKLGKNIETMPGIIRPSFEYNIV